MQNLVIATGEKTFRCAAAITRGSPVLPSAAEGFVETTTVANNAAVFGVALFDASAGGEIRVCFAGIAQVRIAVAAAVLVGDLLATHTVAGTAVEATAGQNSFAKVLQAPVANSDLVTCGITPFTRG